jgi:hypothetical protein
MTAADRYRAACAALGLPVWRPGMLSTHGTRLLGAGLWASKSGVVFYDECIVEAPDFTDPATVGILLAAVREAWQAPYMHVVWMGNTPAGPSTSSWWSACIDCRVVGHGPTEANALIAALEAAAARRGGQP